MSYYSIRSILIGLILASILACSRKQVPIQSPEEAYNKLVINAEASAIGIKAGIAFNDLNAIANKAIPNVLYEDKNIDDDKLMLTVTKTGNLQFAFQDGAVQTQIPLHIYVKIKLDAGFVSVVKEAEFDLIPTLQTQITITEAYDLRLKTKILAIKWVSTPMLDAGFMQLDISTLLEKAILANQEKLTSIIDQKLEKQVVIRPLIDKAWQLLQQPIRLDAATNTWVRFVPSTISYSGLQGNTQSVQMQVQMSGHLETHTGHKPDASALSLPSLQLATTTDSTFRINLVSFISYQQIEEQLNALATSGALNFTQGKQQFQVQSLRVFGNYNDLILKASVAGTINGNVYLRAQPQLDTLQGAIVFKNVSFDVHTSNFLHKTAGWILNGAIEKAIQKKLVIAYKPLLNASVASLNTLLNGIKPVPFVTLKGQIGYAQPVSLALSPDKLVIQTKSTGALQCILKSDD